MSEETKIIRIVVDSSKAVDGSAAATRALANLERSQAQVASTLDRMEQSLGRVGGYLKANLALYAADFASRLFQMGKDALSAAGGLSDLAEQLGITEKGLQALQFSAVQGGVKLEQLETGVSKFSQKMGEAAGGSKEMIDALNAIGVKILDTNGKLRPTEALMQEVAIAIAAMEDPARRSAAAVDFFGKTGARMLPMLKDIAGGFDDMAEKARRGGAMISKEATEKLKELTDASERSHLKIRTLFAENAAGPLTDALDIITRKLENLSSVLKGLTPDIAGLLKLGYFTLQPGALIGMTVAKSPSEKIAGDISDLQGKISAAETELAGNNLSAMQRRLYERNLGTYRPQLEALQRQAGVMAVGGKTGGGLPSDPDNIGIVVAPKSKGVSNPGIKGAGDDVAERMRKALQDSGRELDQAKAFADAAGQGANAVSQLELHFKALKAAQDVFGKTANDNAAATLELTSRLEGSAAAALKLKNLGEFKLGTEEIEKANQLLAAENSLINASAEDRAREIALIRLKQDILVKGFDENDPKERAAIERRGEAIAQNERLKAQGEELKRANELWTEPLKNALQSLQSFTTDWLDGMMEKGQFTFSSLSEFGTRMARRIIAEFASLAILRPMIGSMMGGMTSLGIVSPATASSLGYGSSAGGSGGYGGGFSLPSFGGSGSMFGGLGDWLNTPFTGPYAGVSPSGMQGVPMLSGSAGAGITPLGALGAAAGIGMGAYQLATAGGNTGKTIGGIGSMIGAGISLIPGLAPVGMGISLLSSILPGLFGGGGEYQWAPLAGSNLTFNPGAGGYTASESFQNGGASQMGQYGNVAGTINALYAATGGKVNYGLATGGSIWNNQREGTTSTYAIHPWLGSVQLSEGSGDQSAAVDRMIAKMFYMTATTPGALTGASATLGTALGNKEPTSVAAIQSLLSLIDAYDKLGKVTPAAETALKQINDSFASLTAGAQEYGLSLKPIQDEQAKQTKRYAQDFIDGMLDPLAVQLRALDDQRKDSLASAEYIRDNVKDVFVDMAKITDYWNTKRLDLEAQYQEQSVGQLQALIRRLTYGDLANASPDTSLSGTRGTYEAALAQARAGSGSARSNLAGYAEAYATSARSYFASSAEYDSIAAGIRRDVLDIIGNSGASTVSTAASNALANQLAESLSRQASLETKVGNLTDAVASLTAQLQRRG